MAARGKPALAPSVIQGKTSLPSTGGTLTNPPATNEDGKLKVVYCHDPEGVLIELVEEL